MSKKNSRPTRVELTSESSSFFSSSNPLWRVNVTDVFFLAARRRFTTATSEKDHTNCRSSVKKPTLDRRHLPDFFVLPKLSDVLLLEGKLLLHLAHFREITILKKEKWKRLLIFFRLIRLYLNVLSHSGRRFEPICRKKPSEEERTWDLFSTES